MDPWGYVDAPPHRVYASAHDPAGRPARLRRRQISEDYPPSPTYAPSHGPYLVPESHGLHRSRSTGHRASVGHPPIVTQHVLAEDMPRRGRPLSVAEDYYRHEHSPVSPLSVYREHSRPRPRASTSRDPSPYLAWQHEVENETLRRQLEEVTRAQEKAKEKAAEEQRIQDAVLREQLEAMKKAREKAAEEKRMADEKQRIKDLLIREEFEAAEKKKRDEEERKKFEQRAVEEWQRREKDRAAKEKKDKEQKEEEYKARLKQDLGLSDMQIAKIVQKDAEVAVDLSRTTFTKISRKHISIETLRAHGLPFQLDQKDPEGYVVIKRWIPEYEQDVLWEHTRAVRRDRQVREREARIKAAEEKQRAKYNAAGRRRARSGSPAPGLFSFLGGRR
ncbi:MAG: hypothetical protein M1837_001372 [Sclerophora amabilis]|nr:MAG: hypothetical protein M1837_001372 [Sclerophora amabilis]